MAGFDASEILNFIPFGTLAKGFVGGGSKNKENEAQKKIAELELQKRESQLAAEKARSRLFLGLTIGAGVMFAGGLIYVLLGKKK